MNVLQKADSSAVSTPSTPNSSSLSSQSNLVGITTPLSTPSPATPTQQSNIPIAPPTPAHTLTHKNSLKGTKLARRARSFKDDLFEKISLMRTPNNTLGRSNSPHSPRTKNVSLKQPPTVEDFAKSTQSLDMHVKDICNALKHFRDVILKKKLEVLPGNGTIILETIASLLAVIQSYALNENGAVLLSATQQVYQALGKLIKLCDEVMLSEESDEWASLSNDNVRAVVDLLEDAVKNLVMLAQQKLKEKEESAFKYGPSLADITVAHSQNHLMRPPVEVAGQRTSLPDITLTPKERDILEKTKSVPIRASHSTESILRDTSPPPPAKPPLPNRTSNPPPLPAKKRSQQQLQNSQFNSNNISINSDLDCSSDFSFMNYGVDHLSVRSRSPDENSSQCSLDSALNHSREEEGLENRLDEHLLEDDIEKMVALKTQTGYTGNGDVNKTNTKIITNSSSVIGDGATNAGINNCPILSLSTIAAGIQNVATATVMSTCITNKPISSSGIEAVDNIEKTEMRQTKTTTNHRHSNESGFVSMKSFRTSTQSVSKRSSDYSFQSSNKSSISDVAFNSHECNKHQTVTATNSFNSTATATTTAATSITEHHITSAKIFSTSNSNIMLNDNGALGLIGCSSPDKLTFSERQHHNQLQSFASLTNTNSFDESLSDGIAASENTEPPSLPPKTAKNKYRLQSPYNNFDELDDVNSIGDVAELRQHHHHHHHNHHQQHQIFHLQSKHQSLLEPRRAGGMAGSCVTIAGDNNLEEPPPLPVKKKHILAYMEICSASTRSMEHRHTVHTYNVNRNITHSQTMNIVPQSKELSPDNELPPALPPKNYKQRKPTSMPPTIITTPPPSPKPNNLCPTDPYNNDGGSQRHPRILSGNQNNEPMSTVCEEIDDDKTLIHHSHNLPNVKCANTKAISPELINEEHEVLDKHSYHNNNNNNNDDDNDNDNEKMENKCNTSKTNSLDNLPNLLEELDITPYLVLKKDGEDGPEVKGGYVDALIVHASRVSKVSDNAFSEAFITTFRTFIQPIDVIEKLTHRYTVFFCQLNDQKKRAAKETFSLLVRVVNDLTSTDLTEQLLSLLMEFNYQLVCSGELYLAKVLRNKFVEKVLLAKEQKMPIYQPDMFSTVTNQPSLLDLKSVDIAEQMTLLDAELFQKIEIPEVLLFAKEQCEEKSPNLNKFTEHFNKMSYWARSKILKLPDAKDREKHVFKFIKIMKHLRKMNNYNSYLALLSALDSAPIRRLEWQKTITEGLKEYCTLIDSSSSFRVYRQALAETAPPCIPYIGLVLQDLTFVHVGNPDYLKDGVINFSKRWQQFNIIVNMKRFKKCSYSFRRNERIIRFFENFEHFLDEEQMWQISESIKPRPKRTVQY